MDGDQVRAETDESARRPARVAAVAAGVLVGAIAAGGCGSARSASVGTTPVSLVSESSASSSSVARGTSSVSATSVGSAPSATARACRPSDLEISNPWSLQGGMGAIVVALVFRNVGSQPCAMAGWPKVAAAALHVRVLYQTTTGAGFEVPVTHVVVPPGGSAAVSLNLFGAPNSAYGSQCGEAGSWTVTIPGSTQPQSVPWVAGNGPCPDGTVLVSPVYSGDGPEVGFGSADPQSVPALGPYSRPNSVLLTPQP